MYNGLYKLNSENEIDSVCFDVKYLIKVKYF